MSSKWSSILYSVALAITMGLTLTRALAQEPGDISTKRVTLNVENARLEHVLKLLFQNVSANYVLDPAVSGTVTASLTDVPFKTALESVLKSTQGGVRLTYRIESGVYTIVPRAEPPTTRQEERPETIPTEGRRVIKLSDPRHVDPFTLGEILQQVGIDAQVIDSFPIGSAMAMGGGGFGGGFGGQGGGMGGFGGFGGMGGMGGMGGGFGAMGGMGGMTGGTGGMGGIGGFGGQGGGLGGFGGGQGGGFGGQGGGIGGMRGGMGAGMGGMGGGGFGNGFGGGGRGFGGFGGQGGVGGSGNGFGAGGRGGQGGAGANNPFPGWKFLLGEFGVLGMYDPDADISGRAGNRP